MNFLIPDEGFPSLTEMLFYAYNGGKAVEDTATGNPLTFQTDLARPLKSLLIPFTPRQSGTGDPSPENIRPILPWDGLSVFGGGINQFDGQMEIGTYNGNTGEKSSNPSRLRNVNPIKVKGGTNYRYISNRQTDYGVSWLFYKKDGTFISNNNRANTIDGFNISVPADAYYMNISPWDNYGTVYGNDIGINYPSTETAYEPYKPITETDISFPFPVYGGTLDVVSGVLTVDRGAVRADAFSWETSILTSKGQSFMTTGSVSVPFAPWQNENGQAFAMSNAMVKNIFAGTFEDAPANSFWWNNGRSGYRCVFDQNASVQDLMQFFTDNDVIFCGKLAEPQEIQLTPAQITALVGDNTIWSEADGSMTAVYLKKG